MTDFGAVIDRWPTLTEFSSDMGVTYGAAKQWRRRKSIPARYWPLLCAKAEGRGMDDITLETLHARVGSR